jgi:hypothetical protein
VAQFSFVERQAFNTAWAERSKQPTLNGDLKPWETSPVSSVLLVFRRWRIGHGCADLRTITVIGYCVVPVLVLVTASLGSVKPT